MPSSWETVELRFRRMEIPDLPAVTMLDAVCQPHPWGTGHFQDELNRGNDGYAQVLDAIGKGIVGYICAWFILDELHVGNLGVDPNMRRRGLAKKMVSEAHMWARHRGGQIACLEVRSSNVAGLTLYQALDYQRIAIRRGYYADNGEDAHVLLKQGL